MSGDHNTKSNDEERLLNAELLVEHWMGRYYAADGQREKYMEMMDANAKELDLAMDLLRSAETEMRYAGWAHFVSDNPARKEVYDDVAEFLSITSAILGDTK